MNAKLPKRKIRWEIRFKTIKLGSGGQGKIDPKFRLKLVRPRQRTTHLGKRVIETFAEEKP